MNHLPGFELVSVGLAALHRQELTPAAYLVAIGGPRLRRLGLELPADLPPQPELGLYRKLRDVEGDAAHGSYLSLVRRLESFERALEREHSGRMRAARATVRDDEP